MSTRPVPVPDDATDPRTAIIEAAVRCFQKFGARRSSMSDIAEEAGISRRTLYRIFDDRTMLINAVLQRRLAQMFRKVRERLESYDDLEEALLEGSLWSIEISEQDAIFIDILAHAYDRSVERFMIAGNDVVDSGMLDHWVPLLDRGRNAGIVREGLSNHRAVTMIRYVQTIALLRNDLGREGRREILRDLLLPAILQSPSRP